MSDDYREQLLGMVRKLTDGKWSVRKFRDCFYMFFVDEVPDDALTDAEHAFFGELQMQLDFVTSWPTKAERLSGFMSNREYVGWAANELTLFELKGDRYKPRFSGQITRA